jgi:cellulose synthase/poly-beta-1,6-N-acetylglucosamine synthase-like glycosyltransferase
MDPVRPILLTVAISITVMIAMVPAYVGISVPAFVLETKDDWVPISGPERVFYLVLDGYYVLFVLFNITPFLTLLFWSLYSKMRNSFDRNGKRERSDKQGSGLFTEGATPRVTVIIPCHNEAHHVSAAVTSAIRQTYEGDIEVLVLDDGSTDMTWSIGRTLCMVFHKRSVKVLHKERGGKASALSFGIKASTGKVLVTTDGDSQLDKDAVKEVINTFREHPDAGIVGGYVSIQNTHVNALTKLQEFEYLITQDMIRMNQSDDGNVQIAPGPIFGIRADLAKLMNPLDRTVVEDCDLTQSILSTKMTTRSNDRARALTHAPEAFTTWSRQRHRWIFGQFQAWRENRWHLLRNPWAVYTYFTWAFTAVSVLIFIMFMATTLVMTVIGSDLYSLIVFITIRSLAVLLLYFGTRGMILILHKETRRHLLYLLLLPFYDAVLSFLAAYLYGCYLLRLGTRVKWGGRRVVVH